MNLRASVSVKLKNTDVEWLGKIPAHWDVLPNRALFEELKVRNLPNEEMLSVTINKGVIRQKELLENSSKKDSSNLDRSKYKLVDQGQIAYNKMRAWQGAIGVSDFRGIISPAYIVHRLRDPKNLPKYFHYLFRTPLFAKEAERWSYGITSDMWSLRAEHFRLIKSPVPPVNEQRVIIKFLDHTNFKIDKAIRAKRKIIILLEEQKKRIIHEAVTKGTNPKSSFKSTGIDWLGAVPDDWDVTALRNRYSQHLGKMLDSKRLTGKHSLPYLRNTDVQWNLIRTNDLPVMDISPNEYERYTVKKGDLLVCEGGEIGRCAIWNGQISVCGFQKALHRLRPRNLGKDSPKYLLYVLWAAAKAGAFNDGHVSTIAHLTGDKLRAHRFPFPPIEEQNLIVAKIEKACEKIDSAINKELGFISLLNEMKNRITSDVVTGKLDVQEASKQIENSAAIEDVAPEYDEMESEIMEELNEN